MADFSVTSSTRKGFGYHRQTQSLTKQALRKKEAWLAKKHESNDKTKKHTAKHIKTKIGVHEKETRVSEKFGSLYQTMSDMNNYVFVDGKLGYAPDAEDAENIPTCPGCVLDLYDQGDVGIKWAFEKKYGKIPVNKFIIDYYKTYHDPAVRVCSWCTYNIYYLNGLYDDEDDDYYYY
jgi:hypothetical protein